MTAAAAGAVALAFALDAAFAEPPERAHPVVWLGSAVAAVDRDWPAPRLAGAVVALALPALAAAIVGVAAWAALQAHPALGGVVAGLVLFAATSLRMLLDAASDVTEETESNLDAARHDLRALAGRDASALSPGQVRSAAAESLAENLADGLVAPLLAFAALAPVSLPLATAAAAWVKAVNTLDSMLGYRSKPHGWASARPERSEGRGLRERRPQGAASVLGVERPGASGFHVVNPALSTSSDRSILALALLRTAPEAPAVSGRGPRCAPRLAPSLRSVARLRCLRRPASRRPRPLPKSRPTASC